jgi:hypothetical protein
LRAKIQPIVKFREQDGQLLTVVHREIHSREREIHSRGYVPRRDWRMRPTSRRSGHAITHLKEERI